MQKVLEERRNQRINYVEPVHRYKELTTAEAAKKKKAGRY